MKTLSAWYGNQVEYGIQIFFFFGYTVALQKPRLLSFFHFSTTKVLLMNAHSICFLGELGKIIPELSLNAS